MKRTNTETQMSNETEGRIPNENELETLSAFVENMDSVPTTPVTLSSTTPLNLFDFTYHPNHRAESILDDTQLGFVPEHFKEKEIIAKRIGLLGKGICYMGYKTDHLIFSFADEKILRQLVGLINTYKNYNEGSNLEYPISKDFARFFKLTSQIMVVFYEESKPFICLALQDFFKKAMEKIQPFETISGTLRNQLMQHGANYFAALKISHKSEWEKGGDLDTLRRYFQSPAGEFLGSSPINVEPRSKKPKVVSIKKKTVEKSKGVIANKVALLEQSTCYQGKTADHLIFWFKDKSDLKNLMDQMGNYSRRNPGADNTKDFSHFFKLSDHTMAVFYVHDQFISPALKIAFEKSLEQVKPFEEISADLDKDLVSCEGKSLRMLKSYRKSEVGTGGNLDKLLKHYNVPKRSKKKSKNKKEITENLAKENDKSSTVFLDSMDWREALIKLITVEPVQNNDLSKEEMPQVTGEEIPKIPEFK